MRFLSAFLMLVLAALILCFIWGNSGVVFLNFWPVDAAFSLPLSLLVLGALFSGLLIGSGAAWMMTLPGRLENRRLRREIYGLRHEKDKALPQKPAPSAAPFRSLGMFKKGRFGGADR